MSFSRYAIEKKQVSHDRGVTWEDVTPFETREGALVGTYRTLIECEDAACDLEKTEYTVIDGFLPTELCGDTFRVLPSGIAKRVSWTSGAICCAEWQSARPNTTDRYGTVISHSIGAQRCVQGGYCPSFDYSMTYVNGREMDNFCFDVRGRKDWVCPETLCACFQISEFMPWAEGKTSWKLIQSQHYVREHCSEPWEADGEPNIVGIAERWVFVDETFQQERWVHQVAKTFDDNGNVAEWQSDSTFDYRQMTETELDPSIELLDYVINDGVICWAGTSGVFPTEMYIQIARNESYNSSGQAVYYKGYTSGTDGFSVGTNSADTAYISGMHLWGAGYNYSDKAVTLTNKLSPYRIYSAKPNNVYFRGIFCGVNLSYDQKSGMDYISGVDNILTGTKTGKLLNNGDTVAFPCRIHENLGQIDDYWNSSKIGYVFRSGDGTIVVMETLKLEDGQLVKEHPKWTSSH